MDVIDLPSKYVEPLKGLTIPGFLMKPYFEECLDEAEGHVIIAFDKSTPVGWCLLTPLHAPDDKVLAAFFVHEDYRWQGIGKALSRKAREGKEHLTFRANDSNRGFFESVGMLSPSFSTVAS
jgi:GNAT superfamily N-acetyltransferase